jgi:catechol 2,3-dioxygenase-like lactoylglutathione lyase family enzyme
MLDHVGLEVSDFERSKAFYESALEPLGIRLIMEPVAGAAGFGSDTEHGPSPYFWIAARDIETVDAFHAAAIAAGGTDNGAPGPRPIYHPGYYGAFILDPDGNNVEAVCHRAGGGSGG